MPVTAINGRPIYRLNSFRLEGLAEVDCSYRLVRVEGVYDDDPDLERKLALLCRLLKSEIRVVAEPLRMSSIHLIGICGFTPELSDIVLPPAMQLTPERVKLSWHTEWQRLDIKYGDSIAERKLLDTCLRWALDRAVRASGEWWSFGKRYVSKRPDPEASTPEMNGHPAFYFGFIPGRDGRPELVLDPSICYTSPRSVHDESRQQVPKWIKGQHLLYKYQGWYSIDALGVAGQVSAVHFEDPGGTGPVSLHDFVSRDHNNLPLHRDAFAIQYKSSGEKTKYAHSSLLFRLPLANNLNNGTSTDHDSILPAEVRGARTEAFVRALDGRLTLFGVPLAPAFQMRRVGSAEILILPPPKLRFGGDQEVENELVNARQVRFDALKGLGPAEATAFSDEQLAIVPSDLPREVSDDFLHRFRVAVEQVSFSSYSPRVLPYTFIAADSLRAKAKKIEVSVAGRQGYGLLVLPNCGVQHERRLHDYLKRRLWSRIQTQCARSSTILSFYTKQQTRGGAKWVPRNDRRRDYGSYIRGLALAFLVVNRKWLWKLGAGSVKHNVNIGIDVYHGEAAFTFIYGDADLIAFNLSTSRRQECLEAEQVEEVLVECLSRDLRLLNSQPASICICRDGVAFEAELAGIARAMQRLRQRGLLAEDFRYGVADVRKSNSMRARIYRWMGHAFKNPEMGAAVVLGTRDALLATTGDPMLWNGTAQPLYIVLRDGTLQLPDVLSDIYALSHLAFTAPAVCHRLPFSIELADLILTESSPGMPDQLWTDSQESEAPAMVLHSRSAS